MAHSVQKKPPKISWTERRPLSSGEMSWQAYDVLLLRVAQLHFPPDTFYANVLVKWTVRIELKPFEAKYEASSIIT